MNSTVINKIRLYFKFGAYNQPFRIISYYVIPLLIVSNVIQLNIKGLSVAITMTFITSLLYMINTYFDRDIDKIAHPERLLPSKRVSLRDAKIYIGITFLLFILSLSFINNYMIRIVSIVIVAFYSALCVLKHSKYNRFTLFGIVYGLTAPTYTYLFFYLIGYAMINKYDSYLALVLAFFFLLDVSHDLYGFILDKKGDEIVNVKTLLDILGIKVTYFIILICDILSIAISYFYIFKLELVVSIIIGVTMIYFIYNLAISNYKSIKSKDLKCALIARSWHMAVFYGFGLMLFAKFKPIPLYSAVGLVLCSLMLVKADLIGKKRG